MSDDRPFSPDRWIAPLAIALIAETLAAGFPWIEVYCAQETCLQNPWSHVLLYVGYASIPALFGIVTLLALRIPRMTGAARALGFVAMLGMEVSMFSSWVSTPFGPTFAIFHILSAVLISMATPLLWGSALARLENPGNLLLQKAGRMAAGVIQLGFVFRFVARIRNSGFYGSMGSSVDPSTAIWMLGDLVESLILLWATVESLRAVPDDESVRDRAAKVHKLMRAWVLAILLTSGVSNIVQFAQSHRAVSAAYYLWTGAVYVTVTLAATYVVARCFRLQFPLSDPLTERSGGVVSTGDLP